MQLSLTKNMHFKEPVPLTELRPLVERVLSDYGIKDEALVEKFLILYYHYPSLQQDPLPQPVAEILLDTYRTEQMKLDEMTTYLFFQSR